MNISYLSSILVLTLLGFTETNAPGKPGHTKHDKHKHGHTKISLDAATEVDLKDGILDQGVLDSEVIIINHSKNRSGRNEYYRYKIGKDKKIRCKRKKSYSKWIPTSERLIHDLSFYAPNTKIRLCLQAKKHKHHKSADASYKFKIGESTGPQSSISPNSLDFGATVQGQSSQKTLTLEYQIAKSAKSQFRHRDPMLT